MRILFILKIYVYRQKEQPGQNKLKLPPSTPLTAFSNCGKTTKSLTLKFSDF